VINCERLIVDSPGLNFIKSAYIRYYMVVKINETFGIAIVIPLHNEYQIVNKLSENIKSFLVENLNQNFIMVCDHCNDGTYEYLMNQFYESDRVKIIDNNFEPGYGSAVRSGLNLALSHNNSWAIVIDSDLSNPLVEALALAEFIYKNNNSEFNNCSIIKGNRFNHFGSSFKSAPLLRVFLSVTANRISRILSFGVSKDPTNGFRAIRLSWFSQQKFGEDKFPSIVEELYLAIKSGNNILDFPTKLDYRNALRIKTSFSFNFETISGYLKYLFKIFLLRIVSIL